MGRGYKEAERRRKRGQGYYNYRPVSRSGNPLSLMLLRINRKRAAANDGYPFSGYPFSASGLRKSYGNRMVVEDINIEVNQGEVVGLLGANGAVFNVFLYDSRAG